MNDYLNSLLDNLPPCRWVLFTYKGCGAWRCKKCGAGKRQADGETHMEPPVVCLRHLMNGARNT
jgi:hypothetical protein